MFKFIQTIINTLINRSENQPYDYSTQDVDPNSFTEDFYSEESNIPSVPDEFEVIAEDMSKKYQIPKPLVCAIMFCESSFRPNAVRFEPEYKKRYVVNNPNYTGLPEDELNWLSQSMGLMQCMGNLAIELGFTFTDPLEIFEPRINIEIGCFFLRKLFNKYKNWPDVISSYNQGNPRKRSDGLYMNQPYVDKVIKYWDKYKVESK